MTQLVLLDAINSVYSTIGDTRAWPGALQRIANCFGAKGAALITQREDRSLTSIVSTDLVEAQRAYDETWWKEDFPSMRAIERGYVV